MIEFLKCALWIFVLLILVCLGYAVLYWACHCGSWLGLFALPVLALIIAGICTINDWAYWYWL